MKKPALRVLIVDDDAVDRLTLRRTLERGNLHTDLTEAASLSDARRALAEGEFDCVLLDLMLPDGPGTELLPMLGSTPAIILTGSAQHQLAEEALGSGAQDYLTKGELDAKMLARSMRYAIERRQAELLRMQLHNTDRLASLGRLAASVAHEINNPISFVLANLTVLNELHTELAALFDELLHEDSPLGAQARARFAERVRAHQLEGELDDARDMLVESLEGIERITGIVRQMLTFSRTDSAGEPARWVSLNEVAEWATMLTWPELRQKANLHKALSPDLPVFPGRVGELGQVATNLMTNAIQAIAEGQAEGNAIRVATFALGDAVYLTVEDTGCGIPAELRERVLEPFFTTKRLGEGTGLGLSVSSELIRAHGGELTIEPRPERGTRVIIKIPLQTGIAIETANPHGVGSPARASTRRVLFIDDEPAVLRSYKRLLRQHDIVACGPANVERILTQDKAFDVVICDMMMPDLDGPEVYAMLGRIAPHLVSRTIFLTGGAYGDRANSFLERVDNAILHKPLSRDQLLDAIDAVAASV